MVPAGINGADVIDIAFRRYDLALGAGLGKMAGKVFRIGHLGDLNELMLLGALAGVEMAMRDAGIPVAFGAASPRRRNTTAPPRRRCRRAAHPARAMRSRCRPRPRAERVAVAR